MLDELPRARGAKSRLALAHDICGRLGAASAEYPNVIPAHSYAAIAFVLDALHEDEDSDVAEDLYEVFREAEKARARELSDMALTHAIADLEDRANDGVDCSVGMALRDAAEGLGRNCSASVEEIADQLEAFAKRAGWRDGSALRRAVERGRRYRDSCRSAGNSAIVERVASGAPFENYEVDVDHWSPSPPAYYGELAEREASARAEADEAIVQAAVSEAGACGGRPEFLSIVRVTARATFSISVGKLIDRLMTAVGPSHDLARAAEVSAEVAREDREGLYDDAAAVERVNQILRLDSDNREPAMKAAPPVPVKAVIVTPRSTTTTSTQVSVAVRREAEMDALTHVPGLVGDLVDWMGATSMKPNRTLAFSAALVLVGTLAGRLYESETGLRTNIYTLGLAPSGFGKDHARSCVNILIERARCGEWLGGSKIASGAGMRRSVEDHPAIAWFIDEFAGLMQQMGDHRNVHNAQIRDLLLEYFETAGDVFRGADYAGARGKPCHNPNVGIWGISNPESFWRSCQGLSAADGLLARFLPFSVGETRPAICRPTKRKNDPPAALVAGLQDLTRSRVGGNLNGRLSDGSTASKALVVGWGKGAEDAFYDAKERFDEAAYAKKGRPAESIYARVVENALKIAMIIAIGVDPDQPVLTIERFEHGLSVAKHCAETTLREIKGRLADNDRQREHVDVKRMIVDAGWSGIGRKHIVERLNGRFNERRLDEIVKSLCEGSQEVVCVLRPTKGRPANRFVAVENLACE